MAGVLAAKMYSWKDTNLALFGSDIERAVKKESAEKEPAWGPVRKITSPTLMVWRIKNFQLEVVRGEDIGKFFRGDSYIVLNIEKVGDELLYDVHFWIGRESTADEYGTAAYKTVELDTFLDDKAVQHREVDGFESDLFKTYFNRFDCCALHFCTQGGVITNTKHILLMSQCMNEIDKIPNELLLKIFQYLNGNDLINCTLCNQQWNHLISNDKYIWLSIFKTEMNTGWLWLNKDIIHILNSFNIINNNDLFNKNQLINKNNEKNLKNYQNITEFIIQLLNNPACFMKKLYSYYINIYKIEKETLQTQIIPYLNSMTNDEICFNCIILGPAIDTVHLIGKFMHTLLSWIDLALTMNRQPMKLKKMHTTTTSWFGQGFILRLPKCLSLNDKENTKGILFNTTILHSRKHMIRSRYCYGGSRLFGNCLVETPTTDQQPVGRVNLTQCTINAISSTQIVFYVIDIRKEDSDLFNNENGDTIRLINPYNSDNERWSEIRVELDALTNCMNSEQILIVLGVGSQNDNINNYNLIELASNLGCNNGTCSNKVVFDECDNNHEDIDANVVKPLLNKPHIKWRLWCTSINEFTYTNLEEIFLWTAITYLNKSCIVKRTSNESLTKRIKAIQSRITNYYRVLSTDK
uniref:Putative gelsolin n=1 Tax=Schistosoma mansoni TaxID=6183 RepID=A0A5K4E9E9_SCHMA